MELKALLLGGSTVTREQLVAGAFETLSPKNSQSIPNQGALTRGKLVKMRAKAIRRGIWFRVLSKAERSYIELTIKVLNEIRSHFLAKVLTPILRRLLNALEIKVILDVRKVGRFLVQKLSRIAQSWGNVSANQWVKDRGFIQYLTVSYVNKPAVFKLYSRV